MSTEIIEALAHLVALLIGERHSPPEEGGWVRTRNTAYRPPMRGVGVIDPESKERPQTEVKPVPSRKWKKGGQTEESRRKISLGATGVPKTCSRCGREGFNVRTCIASMDGAIGRQAHREPRNFEGL
tara:strand:- start:1443 stop:1823 length:381 start_codon:yes stop_codon:yes gene_type:complete